MRNLFISIIILLAVFSTKAQQKSIGTWQLYMPLRTANSVVQSVKFVYCSTGQALVKYDKQYQTSEIFDKSSGLSEINISFLAFDTASNNLFIVYTSGTFDIMNENDNTIFSVNDIKNKTISGSKSINAICFKDENAYLSTDFSIQVYNMSKQEFKEAYYLGSGGTNIACYDVAFYQEAIYVSTASGIRSIMQNHPGILNAVNWQNLSSAGSPIAGKIPNFIEVFDNKLYCILQDSLFYYNGSIWVNTGADKYWKTLHLTTNGDELLLTQYKDSSSVYLDKRVLKIQKDGSQNFINTSAIFRPQQSTSMQRDVYYVADLWKGLHIYNASQHMEVDLNSPRSNASYTITIDKNKLYLAAGSTDGALNYKYNYDGYSVFINNWWSNFNGSITAELTDVFDILKVTPDEKRNKTYLSSLYNGLIVQENQTFTIYDKNNSALEAAIGDTRTRVTDVVVDKNGSAIMLNNSAPNPLKALDNEGNWHTIQGVPGILNLKKMIADDNGRLWILARSTTPLMVVDYGDINSPTDDISAAFGTAKGYGNLPHENVNAIVQDYEGDIWVGTGAGIAVFYCSGSALSSNRCDAQRILVQRDGYNEYLFEKQIVKAIAVDGANRKWIGTTNGVWLISADGKEELLQFNESNSPLPSNDIYDIAINHTTGEVFFATAAGMASYQGDATLGGTEHEDVLVYPNPVRPDYTGPIAVKGLVNDANVKITDISGGLIWQGKANGGQAIWDGKNYNGEKAKTGIYLVYSLSNDGKEHYCAKIAFIK